MRCRKVSLACGGGGRGSAREAGTTGAGKQQQGGWVGAVVGQVGRMGRGTAGAARTAQLQCNSSSLAAAQQQYKGSCSYLVV
jgi:hypothetical protein